MNELWFALIVLVNPANIEDIQYIEPTYFNSQQDCKAGLKRGLDYISQLKELDEYAVQGKCIEFFPDKEWS